MGKYFEKEAFLGKLVAKLISKGAAKKVATAAKWGRHPSAGVSKKVTTMRQAEQAALATKATRAATKKDPFLKGQAKKLIGEPVHFFTEPGKYFKGLGQRIRHRAVDIDKLKKKRTIFGMKRYVQKGNKTYQRGFFTGKKRAVVGYTDKGQALVNRSLGGKVGTAAMSGPGFGAMTYMGTKDEHGNKLSQGKRIARGGGETLMWSATPHAAGIYYGGKIVSELFKHNKNKNPHQQILKN